MGPPIWGGGLEGGGGKNWGGEIFLKTHKSEVIHGHWLQEWERYSELEAIHSGKQAWCPQALGDPKGNGLSLEKRRAPALLLISGLCSLVRASCWKRHQR